jgi:hypothetical protein
MLRASMMNFGTPSLDRTLKLSPGPDSAPFSPRNIPLTAKSRIVLGLESSSAADTIEHNKDGQVYVTACKASASHGLFTAASLNDNHAEIWTQDSGRHSQVLTHPLLGIICLSGSLTLIYFFI